MESQEQAQQQLPQHARARAQAHDPDGITELLKWIDEEIAKDQRGG